MLKKVFSAGLRESRAGGGGTVAGAEFGPGEAAGAGEVDRSGGSAADVSTKYR